MNSPRDIISNFGKQLRGLSYTGRWRLVLSAIALVLFFILIFAAKPWDISARANHELKLKDIIRAYFWWAVLINFGGILLMVWLSPWWSRAAEPQRPSSLACTPIPRWFWPLVAAAMLITAGFAFQRLNHSLWDDEEYALRRAVIGAYERKGDAAPTLDRLSWQETFFAYKKPTNHVFYSILARLSLGGWSFVTPGNTLPFSEWAYRLPAYLAGIGSVAVLALLLADFGLPGAGVIAAFLLALHPWHLRYASEARGYAIILLLVPILLIAWKRAMETGRWRAWAVFGATQFFLLHTWPGTLYLLVIINLVTVILFLSRNAPRDFSGRWFFCTGVAGMLVVQFMLPLVPQMKNYLSQSSTHLGFFHWEELRLIFSHLALGAPWKSLAGGPYLEVQRMIFPHSETAAVLAVLLAILMVGGAWLLSKRSPLAFGAGAVLLLAPVLAGLHANLRHLPVFEWYFVYGILGVCAFSAVSLSWLGKGLAALCAYRGAAIVPAVIAIAGYGFLTQPVRVWHVQHPLQQIRESVLLTRPNFAPTNPAQKEIMTVGFVVAPHVYDAHVIMARSPDKFFELLRQADAQNKILFVNAGHPWAANRECPDQWAAIHDPTLFEPPVILHGLDPGLDRVVARYRPGAMATYQFRSERLPLPHRSRPFSGGD